ncbi:MAG: translocation/assembly module TamB domain-containing protein [Terracidiphilus sp.]|nr:translocation/assembly module TamB domain-containing protein [Terracidiphilus sp.]
MSEDEQIDATATPEPEVPEAELEKRHPSRMRRFLLRHVPLTVGALVVLAAVAFTVLYYWMSSPGFEDFVRRRLIATIEQTTGGRAEIRTFHWHVLQLEAEAGGLVLHGTEDTGEAPLVTVERLDLRLSILDLVSPRILVRSLDLTRPTIHYIVYPDGSTNVPTPRRKQRASESAIDKLFDLRAGRVSIRAGLLHSEDRAASFDFQNRYQPLDFAADDVGLAVIYAPGSMRSAEMYRIEAGAIDVNLTRGGAHSKYPPVRGHFQASLELERNAARLRSLRITAKGRDRLERTLEVSGSLQDFAHPKWQGHIGGELDMRLIDPITGYPNAPEGVVRVDLTLKGGNGGFTLDGPVHIDDGAYVGTGVDARGLRLDARMHADAKRLLIDSIVIQLKKGGTMSGVVDLAPWLTPPMPPKVPGDPARRNSMPPPPVIPDIPMNGRVDAHFKDITLDTLLEMVSVPPFQHLGFNTLVNGTAQAQWTNGDTASVSVAANLALDGPQHAVAGELPAVGVLDGTYTHRNGAVALRRLELHLPESDVEAHGELGAYPMASASQFAVDFRSRNLNDFDTVLRELGVKRAGRMGASALPVALGGQAEFNGTWSGSLTSPRLAGTVKASNLAVELVPLKDAPNAGGQKRIVHLDQVAGSASYSEARVAVDHVLITQGNSHLSVTGALEAAPARVPAFDGNSTVHLKLEAARLDTNDVQPFLGLNLPVTGRLDAQLQVDGPLRGMTGAGWAELNNATAYGEQVKRLRVQGTVAGETVHLKQVALTMPAGAATGSGSYDLHTRQFQGEVRGSGVNVAQINWVQQQNVQAEGKLTFHATGSGSFNDPHVEAEATMAGFELTGVPLGNVHLEAHTARRAVSYNLTSRFEGAELTAHGETGFDNGYPTTARMEFARLNIGTLLKLGHVQAFSGESSLAGTITLAGPLARLEELRGEARIQEMEASLSGVHLKSEGGLHALLSGGWVHLDPLHVTGENTDMRVQGLLGLKGARQLDMAAAGSVNLKLAETLDPDLTASGTSTFQMEAHGPLAKPVLQGRVDFANGALSLGDMPNGLSQIHGTLLFNQNRLEVKSLTAMSGGGLLSVGGSLSYQNGLYANLTATGKGIRIRYPQGLSSLADAQLRLEGSHNNLLLSGDVMITRFTVSPEMDFAALAAQANAVKTPPPPSAPSNHVRLDVHIASSPQLNFQNAFAKLAGDVDLRVRGTLATPALLGRISVTEGTATIAGTRYDLQRGEISFTNPVRIEPLINLNATAHVEDYDITLGLHGTTDKLAVNYRSDPPLPEADVVALLALGRTESQQRIYTQQQVKALSNPTTDALLGGALNATVSSRVQKLFGASSVKVDPNYLGALGNSTSRIIVEEQLGRNLTLTYATNVNTTGQQLIQAEVAINRHVSLLVARDESGVFSMVLKATRRYR